MFNQSDTPNVLLKTMSPADFDAVSDRGSIVELTRGEGLAVAGQAIEHCWFPLSGVATVIAADVDGREAEVGLIGYDGMINSGVAVGSRRSPMLVAVQIAGSALRVNKAAVTVAVRESQTLFDLLAGYNSSLSLQAAFSALAFAQYALPQRLARWALMCADRLDDVHVDLTHEALAVMLGVRRAGVTVAVQALARCGAIAARRGGFTILDRPVLMQIAGAGYGPCEVEYGSSVSALP